MHSISANSSGYQLCSLRDYQCNSKKCICEPYIHIQYSNLRYTVLWRKQVVTKLYNQNRGAAIAFATLGVTFSSSSPSRSNILWELPTSGGGYKKEVLPNPTEWVIRVARCGHNYSSAPPPNLFYATEWKAGIFFKQICTLSCPSACSWHPD